MKGKDLLYALDGIDESILKKNMEQQRKQLPGIWIPAIAACLALLIGIGLLWPRILENPYAFLQAKPLDPAINFQHIGLRYEGTEPQDTGKVSVISPQSLFHEYPVVLARAVKVLPEVYAPLPTYGTGHIVRWRIFQLEIIDPLDSGLEGPLWFGLPEDYYQDLTAWDTLLLSLHLQGYDYTLYDTENGNLKTFERFYADPIPYHGDTVAFTDGVFDESLWNHGLWADPPYFPFSAFEELDRAANALIVRRGATLEDTLIIIEQRRAEADFKMRGNYLLSPAAQSAMDSLDPSFLSTGFDWGQNYKERYIKYTRYVAGCPTNEFVLIHPETGEVIRSESCFGAADLENLPDLGSFVAELDLDALQLEPDEIRGRRLYRAAYGWYEKTGDGILAFVKIIWYHESTDTRQAYVVYDDLFLTVTLDNTEARSRQEMQALLGKGNDNLDWFDDREGPIHMLWKI